MKHFSAMPLFATLMLVTALAACGSSNNGSSNPTTNTNGGTTSGTGITGNTNTTGSTGDANTTGTTGGGTATVSVTGSLGAAAFTGKDAVYATNQVNGVTIVSLVVSDTTGLCDAFTNSNSTTTNANVLVVQLINLTGTFATGDYLVQDPNATPTTGSIPTTDAGIAAASLLALDANAQQVDASGGDVKVTAYMADSALAATLNVTSTGSSGIKGTVSAPPCAGLASALNSTGTTTTTKAVVRRLVSGKLLP